MMYFSFVTELASWKVCAQMNVGVMALQYSGGPGSFKRWSEAMVTDSTIIILTGRVQMLPVVTILDIGYLDPLLRSYVSLSSARVSMLAQKKKKLYRCENA